MLFYFYPWLSDVFTNLQRLASNRAHLSAVIAMFVHQESVPTSEVVTGALMRVRMSVCLAVEVAGTYKDLLYRQEKLKAGI